MTVLTRLARSCCLGLTAFLMLTASSLDGGMAKQLQDGRTIFDKSPRLVDAYTTYDSTYTWGATYYFIVELPANAGEPLQKIEIAQRQGGEDLKFYPENTVAYSGMGDDRERQIALADASFNEDTNTFTAILAEAVPPGKTVTLGLKPRRNPQFDGVYLFGVTVFPRGDNPSGLYLGVGRLHFYNRGDDFFWRH